MIPVPAIILAAGASQRLGTPKQAVEWEGEALLHRTARVALEAGFSPVFVVVGAAEEISRQALGGLTVEVIPNAKWAEGMAASLRVGMAALPACASAVLVLVCDQPALSLELLVEMAQLHRRAPDRVIAAHYAGTRGVPALFPAHRFPDLWSLTGDRGARGALKGEGVLEVPFPNGELDVDSPGDLDRQLK